MLLYIDKKKQKRRQIKILSIVFVCLFILISNFIEYPAKLYSNTQELTTYQSSKNTVHSLPNAIMIFATAQYDTPQIICIPQKINREELKTLAQIFQKHNKQINSIYFSPDVTESDILYSILQTIIPSLKKENSSEDTLIITTNYQNFSTLIKENLLYPYTKIQSSKITLPEKFHLTQNTHFPLPHIPNTEQGKEQQNLKNFANDYRQEIQNYCRNHNIENIDFPKRHLFLQNINVCLSSNNEIFCQLDTTTSFIKKLDFLFSQQSNNTNPSKIYLITSLKKINSIDNINKEDGILFKYGKRESILLPIIDPKENSFSKLKKNAGLNPEYHNKNMEFYKFKTVEIDLNDEI